MDSGMKGSLGMSDFHNFKTLFSFCDVPLALKRTQTDQKL